MQWVLIERVRQLTTYVLTKISGSNQAKTETQEIKLLTTVSSMDVTISPAPTAISGWTTDGWREDTTAAAKTIGSTSTITLTDDKTIYAVYKRNATFYSGNSNPNTTVTASQYYNTTNKYSLAIPAASSASDLSGWTKDNWVASDNTAASFGSTYTSTKNVFYAKYHRTATFYYGENKASNKTVSQTFTSGSSGGSFSLTAPAMDAAKVTAMTNNGWTAQDWYRSNTDQSTVTIAGGGTYTGSYNTFYARYKRTITINYSHNDGGSGTMSAGTASQTYISSNSISPSGIKLANNTFTRTSYKFVNWKVGATNYNPGDTVTFAVGEGASKTAIAMWSGYTYTVTYKQGIANASSYSSTTYANQTAQYPTEITLRTNAMTKSDTKKDEYTITFNANGGSVGTTSATSYIPVSYTKNGWSKGSAGTSKDYADGAKYKDGTTDNSTLTLYPCFSQTPKTRTSIKMPTPEKDGFTCTGWWTAASGGTKEYSCNVSYNNFTKNKTVYAQWQANLVWLYISYYVAHENTDDEEAHARLQVPIGWTMEAICNDSRYNKIPIYSRKGSVASGSIRLAPYPDSSDNIYIFVPKEDGETRKRGAWYHGQDQGGTSWTSPTGTTGTFVKKTDVTVNKQMQIYYWDN